MRAFDFSIKHEIFQAIRSLYKVDLKSDNFINCSNSELIMIEDYPVDKRSTYRMDELFDSLLQTEPFELDGDQLVRAHDRFNPAFPAGTQLSSAGLL